MHAGRSSPGSRPADRLLVSSPASPKAPPPPPPPPPRRPRLPRSPPPPRRPRFPAAASPEGRRLPRRPPPPPPPSKAAASPEGRRLPRRPPPPPTPPKAATADRLLGRPADRLLVSWVGRRLPRLPRRPPPPPNQLPAAASPPEGRRLRRIICSSDVARRSRPPPLRLLAGSQSYRHRTPSSALPSSYAAAFFSFSGIGGAGRGRGRGLPPSAPPRAPGSPIPDDDDDDGADPFSAPESGGRGRGESVIPPSPTIPSFSSFSGAGRGRGSPLPPPPSSEDAPKQPTITKRFDDIPPPSDLEPPTPGASSSEAPRSLPTFGAGRGVPRMRQPVDRPPEENCFIRRREAKQAASPSAPGGQPKLSPQDAVKRALELLGRGDDGGRGSGGRGDRGGRGRRSRGGRGRRGPAEVDERQGVYLGDNTDGDRLEEKLGADKMKILNQAFDEAAENALPHPMEDAYLDAAHTNNMIEFEPEYHTNFDNPDIDEKPPMSLEEVLQKVKPFIIAYEGIQNQEEWEGWVTGTGGSITVKANDPSVPLAQQLIVMSPSGVQKERMVAEDMYVLSADGKVLSAPVAKPWPHKPPKCTDCAPLFLKSYLMRGAGAVIHSHGMETCIATMLDLGAKEFRVNQDKRQEFWPNQKKVDASEKSTKNIVYKDVLAW